MYFHVSLYVPSTETDLSEIKSINSKTFPSYLSANSSESISFSSSEKSLSSLYKTCSKLHELKYNLYGILRIFPVVYNLNIISDLCAFLFQPLQCQNIPYDPHNIEYFQLLLP